MPVFASCLHILQTHALLESEPQQPRKPSILAGIKTASVLASFAGAAACQVPGVVRAMMMAVMVVAVAVLLGLWQLHLQWALLHSQWTHALPHRAHLHRTGPNHRYPH